MIWEKRIMYSVSFTLLLFVNLPNRNDKSTNLTDSITVGGLKRTYLLHIPLDFDINKSRPLLIALHGGGGTGRNMVKLTMSEFDMISDKSGFIVVYPDGIEKHWNDGRGNKESGNKVKKDNIDDVGFIGALISHLIDKMNIDPKRVYVTGMSNGAIMAYRLACELSDRIAAIAPVAGNIPQNLLTLCSPSRAVSVLAINGTNDPLVPFGGGDVTGPFGQKKLGKVLSASASVKFWAKLNNCSMAPVVTFEPHKDQRDKTRIRKEAYRNDGNNIEVILYSIEGGGHTWPGGFQYFNERIIGKTSRDINASGVIWEFFSRHSMK